MGALEALRDEAGDGPVVVEWRGHRLAIAADLDSAPVEVLEAFEDGKATRFVRELIGDDTYRKLKRKEKLTGADLGELGEVLMAALGFDLGE